MTVTVPWLFPDPAHMRFIAVQCSVNRQGHIIFFYLIYASFWNLARMSVEIQPCNCWYYDIVLTVYVIDRPGADFCTSLSIWTGTTDLPDQVWLQKLNPEVFCDIARHVVLSNCSSKCSVGRNLYMYTMSHNGNKILRENMRDVHLLLFCSKNISL